MTGDKAKELFAGVLSGETTHYTGISLSGWSIRPGGAAIAAQAIAALPIERANLANTIGGQPEAQGLKTYEVLGEALKEKHLLELNLSSNAVGAKGVASLTPLLASCTALESISFDDCGMSAEAVASICSLIAAKAPTALRKLHSYNNMAGGGGAKAAGDIILASPAMEDVRFASTRGDREGGEALGKALAQARALRHVDLSDNTFGAGTGIALAAGVLHQPALTTLNIGDITLENEGLLPLASALLAGVAAGVGAGMSLAHLDLSFNEPEGEEAVAALCALVARLPALQRVVLSNNELYTQGLLNLAGALKARAAAGLTSLQELHVSEVYAYTSGVQAVAEAAAALPGFKLLVADGNYVSEEGLQAVAAAASAGGFTLGPWDMNDPEQAAEEEGEAGDLETDVGDGAGSWAPSPEHVAEAARVAAAPGAGDGPDLADAAATAPSEGV